MSPLDRELAFGKESIPASGYLWCLHCERAYKYGEYRLEYLGFSAADLKHMRRCRVSEEDITDAQKPLQMCPYLGCDGSTVLDGMDWDWVRGYHPEYPEVPELGCVYGL
jgi:hypothetical protein